MRPSGGGANGVVFALADSLVIKVPIHDDYEAMGGWWLGLI
jgi:hypothetical protein